MYAGGALESVAVTRPLGNNQHFGAFGSAKFTKITFSPLATIKDMPRVSIKQPIELCVP